MTDVEAPAQKAMAYAVVAAKGFEDFSPFASEYEAADAMLAALAARGYSLVRTDELDVERLAEALASYWAKRYGPDDAAAHVGRNRQAATDLAAEYVRLAKERDQG